MIHREQIGCQYARRQSRALLFDLRYLGLKVVVYVLVPGMLLYMERRQAVSACANKVVHCYSTFLVNSPTALKGRRDPFGCQPSQPSQGAPPYCASLGASYLKKYLYQSSWPIFSCRFCFPVCMAQLCTVCIARKISHPPSDYFQSWFSPQR